MEMGTTRIEYYTMIIKSLEIIAQTPPKARKYTISNVSHEKQVQSNTPQKHHVFLKS